MLFVPIFQFPHWLSQQQKRAGVSAAAGPTFESTKVHSVANAEAEQKEAAD